ncbi:MAG: ergothioneine biosynthesis protein EgtB [Aestuariibacter sp.]
MPLRMLKRFKDVREVSRTLASPLSEADAQIQSMEDASPAKWHLAHTSWFFETLILIPYYKGYEPFNQQYQYLFNSYYNGIGKQFCRASRGMLSRPSMTEVMHYRQHVDNHMCELLESSPDDQCIWLTNLGTHHEQQHQELLLTDVKHAFSQNPLYPRYRELAVGNDTESQLTWINVDEGIFEIGTDLRDFAFDNESPKHKVYLHNYALSNRLVTNAEYLKFIEDGGYQTPQLWLSDGWAQVQNNNQDLPIYWQQNDSGEYQQFTLGGLRPVMMNQPVTHLNYYEADAYARWCGARLPSEFEWEVAAANLSIDGPFLTLDRLHPYATQGTGLVQMFGQCWQWTSSAYSAYPGYTPFSGAVGEYNGKFMSGQQVLRGGSCVTPESSYRLTYRNFFYPHQAWQFTGIRLAKTQ